MYIQYSSKKGKIYSLNLSELSTSVLLLMFCWVVPKKLYLTEGVYARDKEITTFQISMIVAFSTLATKIIDFEDTYILYHNNYFLAACVTAVLFGLNILMAKWHSKQMHKKMLKKIKIIDTKGTLVYFKPKGIGSWLGFALLFYVAIRLIPECLRVLSSPTISSIIAMFVLIFFIVLSPFIGIICCDPIIDGERLERISL